MSSKGNDRDKRIHQEQKTQSKINRDEIIEKLSKDLKNFNELHK